MITNSFENPWEDPRKPLKGNKTNSEDLENLIKRGQEKLFDMLKGRRGQGGNGPFGTKFPNFNILNSKFFLLILGVIVGLWLSTGFYTIQPDEEGVVLRFGSYIRTATPGLNYRFPSPIETMTKVSVTRINREEIGFRSQGTGNSSGDNRLQALLGVRSNDNAAKSTPKNMPKESQMLTGDENIIDIDFDVQWKINDAKKYLFNLRDLSGENTVKSSAESAVRDVIGHTNIYEALAEERHKVEQDSKKLLQEILDHYDMGVEVVRLQMLRVEPPPQVLDAYRDVQSAKADREREINRAYSYRNDILPRARGEAAQMLQQAEGYKQYVTANAKGEANRFRIVNEQYKNAKEVTRKRMYLDAMQEIMSGMNKMVLPTGGTIPILPLNELLSKTNQMQNNPPIVSKSNMQTMEEASEAKNESANNGR